MLGDRNPCDMQGKANEETFARTSTAYVLESDFARLLADPLVTGLVEQVMAFEGALSKAMRVSPGLQSRLGPEVSSDGHSCGHTEQADHIV